MKNISLYVEQDTYLTRLHPFAKLTYILAAVSVVLLAWVLWRLLRIISRRRLNPDE